MAHSSLLGIDRVATTAPGHDSEALGPSDSSDSGSDVAGLADLDDGDPGLPVDVATDGDSEHPRTSFESLGNGSDTDASGTGERRSASGDAGLRDGADIAPDRIVSDPDSADEVDDDGALRALDASGGEDDENDEVEPRVPGGGHPKAHSNHPARRERDHGLSGPDPDMPAQTPPPVNDPSDEGVNDEGDEVVVVPAR